MTKIRPIRDLTSRWLHNAAIVIIISTAVLIRTSFLDWDGGNQLNPDERAILFVESNLHWPNTLPELLRVKDSGLNPFRATDGSVQQYPYGHLPLYLNLTAADILGFLCSVPKLCHGIPSHSLPGYVLNLDQLSRFKQLTYIGRLLSALFDSLTVLVTYWLARRFKTPGAGLLASSLAAVAVLHIQNSHFGTVDSAAAFFATMTITFLTVYGTNRRQSLSTLAGIALGLAVGCKLTGIFLFIPFIVVHYDVSAVTTRSGLPRIHDKKGLAFSILVAILSFVLTNPYALLDPIPFVTSLATQAQVTSGLVDWPFTRQYQGTIPVIYSIVQQAQWTLGLPLTVFAYVGTLLTTIQWVRAKDRTMIPALLWVWLGVLVIGSQSVKFPRYELPFAPTLFAVATAGWQYSSERSPDKHRWRFAVGEALVLIVTLGYALAFVGMYRLPHPWVEASEWIYGSMPAGTKIVSEQWDDPLPLDLEIDGGSYLRESVITSIMIDPFGEPDNLEKIDMVAESVATADYIILSSNRLYGVIPRFKTRYPLTSAYYHTLFGGAIGYQLDRTFARYPTLFSVSLVDNPLLHAGLPDPGISWPRSALVSGSADESFTVYDHPLVIVFKNEKRLTAQQIIEAILQAAR